MDCLLAKCVPCITNCVMGELEKLGGKYKIALRLAKDPRFERIPCNCKGCYADDCLTNMVKQWRCFIVATCDKELRGRIRKIPGVPCMYISGYKYTVEVSTFLVHRTNFIVLFSSSSCNRSGCQKLLEPLHRVDYIVLVMMRQSSHTTQNWLVSLDLMEWHQRGIFDLGGCIIWYFAQRYGVGFSVRIHDRFK